MKYYMLSGLDAKNDYNFYPEEAEILKKNLKNFNTLVYIPTYPDDIEKCNALANKPLFENIGIKFDKVIVLNDSYTKSEIRQIMSENELFFLFGGNPFKQIDFINKNNITELIKNKTIIGLSAGSINMCKVALCTKDEDFANSTTYEGMGLINFSIEPHFDKENQEVLNDLKQFAKFTKIFALEDNAFIIVENNDIKFYGNIYEIK